MMNAMPRTLSARQAVRSAGQSLYEVVLIIACAAMALAVVFAVYEYFSFYYGPTTPSNLAAAAATRPVSKSAAPAQTVTPPPAPTVTPTPGTTAAPTVAPATTAAPAATAPSN
jgi:hypothetical protein